MECHTSRLSQLKLVYILGGISGILVIIFIQVLGRSTWTPTALNDNSIKPVFRNATPPKSLTQLRDKKIMLILYWNSWFGEKWAGEYKRYTSDTMEGLRDGGCPEWQCEFTYNKTRVNEADAIMFRSNTFGSRPKSRRSSQRWVWVDVEAPLASPAKSAMNMLRVHNLSHLVNWTMTYHSNSDIVAFYGYFRSLNTFQQPLRPNIIENHPLALSKYRDALAKGTTLENIMGASWTSFVERPRLIAWMSSHCSTVSKREEYVRELSRYIPVDKYGSCGQRCDRRSPRKPLCWLDVLSRNYSFYLAMENNVCDEYMTEKLYNPLVYNLVPVVWGGSNYEQFLPPNSYIDARGYHPKELAQLLQKLKADPVAYGKYHVWRGFWEARVGGNLCELCYRLHADKEEKHYTDIGLWRQNNNKCKVIPKNMFDHDIKAWTNFIRSNYSS
ncbi:alpha-(1,3)-fucosyltransferase C-like [Penaeus japonicus]|uniref:alpha-(1,3)-fucosyltransferase C-like n=1 Tax=Penaeus japonicus TaxID=27405 RepID=UPI001C70E4AB|nr:alpha-(1,3)-fucosyltransferase C-like [Penaeus japonicus]